MVPLSMAKLSFLKPQILLRRFSLTKTPYPLYYELISHRPLNPHPIRHRRETRPEPEPLQPESEPDPSTLDRSKRKYLRKRNKRMFGSDSDSETTAAGDDFVELKPEVVDFHRLHAREQELYFYDAFAFPWEKDKHYRMVYQLEKKYFPDQCLDKAFEPETEVVRVEKEEKKLVFFEEGKGEGGGGEVTEKKVEEFFKCLKKVPSGGGGGRKKDVGFVEEVVNVEPFLTTRRTQLPPRWDGPAGTVVLIDKPKGRVFLISL